MDQQILQKIQLKYGKQNPPRPKAGDTVRVHERIIEKDKQRTQIFEGLVLAVKHGFGLNGSFTVRKIAVGAIGVEKVFPIHSPNILKVERIKSAKTNRSKIYFMRDRFGKAAKINNEKANPAIWEEKGAEAELKKIEEEVAKAAEEKIEEADENIEDTRKKIAQDESDKNE